MRATILTFPMLLALTAARAAEPVRIWLGAHGTSGRVTFAVPRTVTASLETLDSDTVHVVLPGAGSVPGSVRGTRNVIAVDGGDDGAVLILAPGSHVTLRQSPGHVVLEVNGETAADAARGIAAAPVKAATGIAAAPRIAPASVPAPTQQVAMPRLAAAAVTTSTLAAPGASHAPPASVGIQDDSEARTASPAMPPPAQGPPASTADSLPTDGLVASRLPADAGDALLVPFDRDVGAAAFARGGVAHVVFDESKPIDLAQLKGDPLFGGARVMLLPAATHLTVPLAPGKRLALRRRPEGWVLAIVPDSAPAATSTARLQAGEVHLDMPQAASSVVLDDPATGGKLLVGTVTGDGPGVAVAHRSPEFALLPSWDGVVVAPQSDRLALQPDKTGFTLSAGDGRALATVISPEAEKALAEAGTLTRHFDLTDQPVAMRRDRLASELAVAATAPRLGRYKPRLRAAEDMLALGMAPEAAALMRVALEDDPDKASDPDAVALLAMANWLAGRGDGAALTAPALGNSDEIALWRAVLQPGEDSKSAATLANSWRIALAYPEPLRRALLPKIAARLLRGGERAAAADLLAKVPESYLDNQRALALQMDGKTDATLALLDRIGAGADRKRAAAALRDGVELRLAAGKITPAAASDLLDKYLYAWRDDATEEAQRLRIAALRDKAGAWRQALAGLRETDRLFPDAHDRVRAAEKQTIADLLAAGAAERLAPLDLVALVEENEDLLAEKGASETLAPVLVDKLMALDLPDRADPILTKLAAVTQSPAAKAALGARLAALRLEMNDTAGVLTALRDTDSATLPPDLAAHRTVLQARAVARQGDADGAMRLIAGLSSPEALELQARLLEKRKDWHGAEGALQRLAGATLPSQGALSDAQQDLVLRLASAAAEAGDIALMQHLQVGDGTRLGAGPRAELFQALTAKPVQAIGDLARSGREAVAARAVPAALASYDAH
ncbi:MAG TPA: hypothetical protein VMB71_04615 [Acetobacteraceae bacterium]|nr:hypothetical protein [Acetobacteraceae bacterium]